MNHKNHSVPGVSWDWKLRELLSTLFVFIVLIAGLGKLNSSHELNAGMFCASTANGYAGIDLHALDAFEQAQKIGDHYGVQEMKRQGKWCFVPAGTHMLVLDSHTTLLGPDHRRVRVLNGECAGQALWINKTLLRRIEPSDEDRYPTPVDKELLELLKRAFPPKK